MLENFLESYKGKVEFDVNMGKHTSFKTGGFAKIMFTPLNILELKEIIKALKEEQINYVIVGNGSNLLFTQDMYDGAIIKIGKEFESTEILREGNKYTVSAGTILVKFANQVCKDGFKGIEFGSGIPGSVGGGIYMNAGCYGREMVNCVTSVSALNKETLEIENFTNEQCGFRYRNSFFQNDEYVILSATFEFEKGDETEIKSKIDEYKKSRTDNQPLTLPSAGSTFKRPDGDFAGRLIEVSGLKGYNVGGAEVSEKHAGFVVNKGGATPKDIIELIEHVKSVVKEKTGVQLELEVKVI